MRREKKDYVVITFHTTAEAMAMEQYCMEYGIKGRLIPVPREISAGCGISWRMTAADYAAVGRSSDGSTGAAEWEPDIEYERIVKIRM